MKHKDKKDMLGGSQNSFGAGRSMIPMASPLESEASAAFLRETLTCATSPQNARNPPCSVNGAHTLLAIAESGESSESTPTEIKRKEHPGLLFDLDGDLGQGLSFESAFAE